MKRGRQICHFCSIKKHYMIYSIRLAYKIGIINHLKNIVITIKIQIQKSNKASYVHTTKFSILVDNRKNDRTCSVCNSRSDILQYEEVINATFRVYIESIFLKKCYVISMRNYQTSTHFEIIILLRLLCTPL